MNVSKEDFNRLEVKIDKLNDFLMKNGLVGKVQSNSEFKEALQDEKIFEEITLNREFRTNSKKHYFAGWVAMLSVVGRIFYEAVKNIFIK